MLKSGQHMRGKTAVDMAREGKHQSVVSLLEQP